MVPAALLARILTPVDKINHPVASHPNLHGVALRVEGLPRPRVSPIPLCLVTEAVQSYS